MAALLPNEIGPMSDGDFRMFSQLLREHCGLNFVADTRFLLEKRIERRMRQRSITSHAAYHYALRSESRSTGELAELVDEVTTNETYFFRERRQLRALVEEIFPELLLQRRERSGGPIAVWSAGCASGEEPFSIVMMALEANLEPGRDFRVYACDISRSVLVKARRGLYREASFRDTDRSMRLHYFAEKDGLMRLSDEVKCHVDFVHMNLLDSAKTSLLGTMDVILCRNVMIYFDLQTRKKVIGTFHERLKPGGYLLLGHSESLINVTSDFELKHLSRDLVYRRPVPGEEVEDRWHALARAGVAEAERSEPT